VYSGVFCLLALRGARDWKLGENLQLQDLQDHHIFPRAYLHNHGLIDHMAINSIVNRTLISDVTNNQIRAKAPADYLEDLEVFPAGSTHGLMEPHFLTPEVIGWMREGTQQATKDQLRDTYEAFCAVRERAIISEIRRVCGVSEPAEGTAPPPAVGLPPSPAGAPFSDQESPRMATVLTLADESGCGDALRSLLSVARRMNLRPVPHVRSVVFAPPSDGRKAVFAAWVRDGSLELGLWFDRFESYMGIPAETARAVLGTSPRNVTGADVRVFKDDLERLMGVRGSAGNEEDA
jgi:hypothetical protein